MKRSFTVFPVLIILFSFFQNAAFSQWSIDPAVNYAICDTANEQALTKNSPTLDGGIYVSWFDQRAGSYAVYLQKLDIMGNKLFGNNGLLISNKPQSSSLVDYDLATDAQGNAIVAFTDTRNGSSINPFAYKISPSGQFLWGADGVSLTDDPAVYQANPKIVCASDGNYFIVWLYASTPRKVAYQKINSAGVKQFPAPKFLSSGTTELYDWPWPIASDNGSFILLWSGYTGSFLNPQNYKLYSQKFSTTGDPVWNATRDTVYSLGRMTGFYTPRIFSDGNNGAVYVWQDDRNATNQMNCYVQRKNSAGQNLFPVNGSVVGTNTTDVLRFTPMAAVMTATNETYVYWQQKNGSQSLIGLYGQKFSAAGAPLWDAANGIAFKPLESSSFSSHQAFAANGRVYNFYLEIGANNLSTIKGFAHDAAGTMVWPGNIVTLSSYASSKIRLWSSRTTAGNFVTTWEDERNDGGGIYGMQINSTGTFTVPVELSSFTASVSGSSVTLNWTTSTEKNNNGFYVERKTIDNDWQSLGFVKGFGTTTETRNYSFTDKNVIAGFISYRLKQVDFDGSSEYSKIIEVDASAPAGYALMQNYPNPFNPSTTINFSIAQKGNVILKVYDAIGNEVAILVNSVKEAGNHEISFNASGLPSGIYFYELNSGSFRQTSKMMLVK